jgi:hypothetical protein
MSSNSNPVVNSCCALVYTSLYLIVKSELISTKSFPQRMLRSQNSAGNWERCLMTTCTLNFGFCGKVRGAKHCCPVSTEIPLPSPVRKRKQKKPDKPWKYNSIHIHTKNYMYEVISCMGALSSRSSTECSRCTGPKPCTLHHSPSTTLWSTMDGT